MNLAKKLFKNPDTFIQFPNEINSKLKWHDC